MTKRAPLSPEVRERAIRMVHDHQSEHRSRHAAIRSTASKIGCSGETLCNWIKEAESSDPAQEHQRLPRHVVRYGGEAAVRTVVATARLTASAGTFSTVLGTISA